MASPDTDASGGGARRIADAFIATLCAGASLGVWRACGILEREWTLYERLSARYGRIVLVTEGGGRIARSARGCRAGAR